MVKVQLISVEGAPVTITVVPTVLARLVSDLETAFDNRLEQARASRKPNACTGDAVLVELIANRAQLRRLLGEDAHISVRIERENDVFEVDSTGEPREDHKIIAGRITRVDLAEYQLRHGHGYQHALPHSVSIQHIGYWCEECGQERYVPAPVCERIDDPSSAANQPEESTDR